jgi:WD40 repeat protein
LWDIATGMIVNTLHESLGDPNGKDAAWSLARFSPQGDRLLAANGSGYVALWNTRSSKVVWSKHAHRGSAMGLAYSHDGKLFASGGFDGLIHIWNAESLKEVMSLKGHLNEIWSLEFSPDDHYLLTSSKDETVRLWDAQTKPKPGYWTLDAGEWPIGFTPDGRGLISVSNDGKTLRYWNGPQVVRTLSSPVALRSYTSVLSPDRQTLYAGNTNGEIQVLDVNTLRVKYSFKVPAPCRELYHISRNERWLAGWDATLRNLFVWDVASGKPLAHITGFNSGAASHDLAVFSPDNRLLAYATDKDEVKLWNIAEKRVVQTLGPHPWIVYAICFSPDSRYVASSSWAGDIRIFDVATGKEIGTPLEGHGSGVCNLGFSPNGATLVSAGDDDSVRFWNVATGREMLRFENAWNRYARLPVLSPTGELLVYHDDTQNGRVRVTAIPTLAEIEKEHQRETTGILDYQTILKRQLAQWSPENTISSMQLAFALAWTGQTNEYEAFCRRVLGQATKSNDATIERAAKAYLIRGSNPSLLKLAVSLDERAWRIGKNGEFREWIPMNLGLARYREQDYAGALEILPQPVTASDPLIKGPSLMIQAMALQQLGRTDEARKSFEAGESLMKTPPPAGQLTEAVLTQQDDVFFWLLHAEAKALIEGRTASQ